MNSNHSERYVKADPVIIMINSQGEMRQINLASFRKDYVTIGRGSRENDIVIPDSIVSSVHGYLVNRNGRFYYKDLKSKNGSYAGTLGHELFCIKTALLWSFPKARSLRSAIRKSRTKWCSCGSPI